MAFEPNFENVVTSVRKKLGDTQSQVEFKLPIDNEVSKVVCSNAKANILSVETVGKEIVYTGVVSFQFVYLDANSEATSLDYTAEFKDKYLANIELVNVVPVVSASVIDVNTAVNGDLRVAIIVETNIDAIINESSNVLTSVGGNTYFAEKESLNYFNYVSTLTNTFELNNDIEIKDGVNKVLSVCPSEHIEKIDVREGFVIINGHVYYNICYLTDNNIIRTLECKFDFEQELPNDDIDENCVIQSDLKALYNDIKVTTNIDTDSSIVNIVLPLMYQGYIFKNDILEVVSDMYSTSNYTSISAENIESIKVYDSVVFDEKLNGSVVIGENDPFIDEVLGNCCSNVVIANSMIQDGFLIVEGVATTTVLYLNKETNTTNSVIVEMPFSTSTAVEYEDNVSVIVRPSISQLNSRARRGKEIEVTAALDLYCDIFDNFGAVVITKVVEEDEYPDSDCAMSFYITREGDTIWSIAKELRVSKEQLLTQNPSLNEQIPAGTRVVVYRQKQVEY